MNAFSDLPGVGSAREKMLWKLGIHTLSDLVHYFPRSYQDRTQVCSIDTAPFGGYCTVIAYCTTVPTAAVLRKGLHLVKCQMKDDTGTLSVTFFNQLWLKDKLQKGGEYMLYGKMEGFPANRTMTNPAFEEILPGVVPRILPIYGLTAGLSQAMLGKIIQSVFSKELYAFDEVLPPALRERYGLCSSKTALLEIHRPTDDFALQEAKRRLIFEELLILQLGLALLKGRNRQTTSVDIAPCAMEPFYENLPFALTGAQRRTIQEGLLDFGKPVPMSRLVQGDVGSGKTAVAAALAYAAIQSGYQVALMAPTEILAEQHFRTLEGFLSPLGITVSLLTGSLSLKEKRGALARLENGEIQLMVGTHALISDKVAYANLGLVITDEQHRFGVNQRAALAQKGCTPHTLVMSATPIPRTLALMIYGDLDVSIIDELPQGRQKIDTFAVGEDKRSRIERFTRKLLDEGRQAFVVCPLVEAPEDGSDNLKDVQSYAENLQKVLSPYQVSFLHGKLKAAEKERIMAAFSAGDIHVLVSTTVIEVGVDVPNAALMLIENAERFGLSQLHQLRGRVGRGPHKSYCVLLAHGGGQATHSRLETMVYTNDGFRIAEKDLEIRGPGEFFGERQHGLPELKIANMATDMEILRQTSEAVLALLEASPRLESPELSPLRKRINTMFAKE